MIQPSSSRPSAVSRETATPWGIGRPRRPPRAHPTARPAGNPRGPRAVQSLTSWCETRFHVKQRREVTSAPSLCGRQPSLQCEERRFRNLAVAWTIRPTAFDAQGVVLRPTRAAIGSVPIGRGRLKSREPDPSRPCARSPRFPPSRTHPTARTFRRRAHHGRFSPYAGRNNVSRETATAGRPCTWRRNCRRQAKSGFAAPGHWRRPESTLSWCADAQFTHCGGPAGIR